MSFTRRLVPPKLPTTLANDTHVDLPGYDAWLYYVDNVYVIPTELDVSKFEDALSRVLQLYPHTAGQLRCTNGRWSIELTNTAVPMDINYKLSMSSDSFLSGDSVLQDDLSPLVNQQALGVDIINTGAPLLRLKLTLFPSETCIGVSWNHSLGDANTILRFMHMLSQFYQGLPPEYPVPIFRKHHFPTPSMEAKLSAPLHPNRPFDLAAFFESRQDLAHVTWRIDCHDLEELRSVLNSDSQNGKYLSKQDCLTAYCVAVSSHDRSVPIQKVSIVSSYRHISASFVGENVAGNLILIVSASVPMDMAGIATAVRDALVRSREPSCIYILQSLQSEHMLEAANAGKPIPFSFDEDELFVNSTIRIDWCSAHFGSPDGTRFYTSGIFKGSMRCFRTNPVKGDDGVWRARHSIDISMGVSAELKPKILGTLARGVRYMLDNQHVQP